eukprot:1751225-Prorocentrum_lima.AAC.1
MMVNETAGAHKLFDGASRQANNHKVTDCRCCALLLARVWKPTLPTMAPVHEPQLIGRGRASDSAPPAPIS